MLALPGCFAVFMKHLHGLLMQIMKQLLGQACFQQCPLPCLGQGQP